MNLELSEQRNAPAIAIPLGYRSGSTELVGLLNRMQNSGTRHVTLKISSGQRPVEDILQELASDVLPFFHAVT